MPCLSFRSGVIRVWIFTLIAGLLAGHAAANPLQQPVVSPRGTFRLEFSRTPGTQDGDGQRIWVVSKTGRRLLPSHVIYVDYPWARGDNTYDRTDLSPYDYECHISPDERWICIVQKVYHRCAAAYLYKRRAPLDYRPVSSLQFDLMAWRDYARTHGKGLSHVPTKDPEAHLIDFVGWSADSRRLRYGLRPVSDGRGYEWYGYYDTRTGRFHSDRQRAGR